MERGGRKILKDKTKKLGGNQIIEALGHGFGGIQNAEKAPEKVKNHPGGHRRIYCNFICILFSFLLFSYFCIYVL